MANLRHELKTDMANLRDELKTDMGSVRDELQTDIGNVRDELGNDVAKLDDRLRTVEIDVAATRVATAALTTPVQAVEEPARHPVSPTPG